MTLRAFTMPHWGGDIREATLTDWLVGEGEAFDQVSVLALIETEKVSNEVEAEAGGVLLHRVVAAGETAPVGALLAVIGDAGDTPEAALAFAAGFRQADGPAPDAPAEAEASANPVEILPMSPLRKTIAHRVSLSNATIPHFYLHREIRVDPLIEARAFAAKLFAMDASINDLLVRAAALALIEVPDVNIQVHGEAIHRFADADVAIAVATERGFMTPVLRAANKLRIQEIAALSKELTNKARAGHLAREEIEGGTFTVSNLGMFGIDAFDAIINPPQGAILAVGAARRVWREGPQGVGHFESRLSLSLACDHRAIDGMLGARFLDALKRLIDEPKRLL